MQGREAHLFWIYWMVGSRKKKMDKRKCWIDGWKKGINWVGWQTNIRWIYRYTAIQRGLWAEVCMEEKKNGLMG